MNYILPTFWSLVFLAIAIIDVKRRRILNVMVYPLSVVAITLSIFYPVGMTLPWWPSWLNGIMGGITGIVCMLLLRKLFKGGVGWGDVKAGGLVGLITGFPLVVLAIGISLMAAGLTASFKGHMLLRASPNNKKLRKSGQKPEIAFGPFLATGVLISVWAGPSVISWYQSLWGNIG